MAVTQFCLAFCGISLVISFFFVLKAFDAIEDSKTVELLLYFISMLVVRILFKHLQTLIEKILKFEYKSPEQAVHLPILLKSASIAYSPFPRLDRVFEPEVISFFGLLNSQGIDTTKLKKLGDFKDFESELYTAILERFSKLVKIYPRSQVLKLCMARIYMRKLGAASKAISLLKNMDSKTTSIHIRNSIDLTFNRLEYVFTKAYLDADEKLETVNYFKYREIANTLKKHIQNETDKHIELWKELVQNQVDVMKVVNIARSIEEICHKAKKLWNVHTDAFIKVFSTPILLYGVYLETVRDLPHESWPIIQRYYEIRKSKAAAKEINKFNTDTFSEHTAVIVASVEMDKIGKVIDASASVLNLFNVEKEKLLGQKINMLMPTFIAQKHDDFIRKYNRSSTHRIDLLLNTVAKTWDGYFFSAEISVKVYPSMKEGVNAVSFIKKLAHKEPMFVVGADHSITDCSKDIEEVFKLNSYNLSVAKIDAISHDFDNALNAFDVAYAIPKKKPKEEIIYQGSQVLRSPQGSRRVLGSPEEMSAYEEQMMSGYHFGDQSGMMEERPLMFAKGDESSLLSPEFKRRGTWKFSLEMQSPTLTPRIQWPGSPGTMSTRRLSSTARIRLEVPKEEDEEEAPLMEKEVADDICQRYKEGVRMNLYPFDATGQKKPQPLEFLVKMDPLTVDGVLYKLIKLKRPFLKDGSSRKWVTTSRVPVSPGKSPRRSLAKFQELKVENEEEFADNFPLSNEKIPGLEEKDEVESIRRNNNLSFNTDQVRGIFAGETEGTELWEPSMSQGQDDVGYFYKKKMSVTNDGGSSKRESINLGLRIVKTLNNVFTNEKLRSTTKIAILFVYVAFLVVIALAAVDYKFSGDSIDEIKNDVLLIDIASKRLYYNIMTWQWELMMFSSQAKTSSAYFNYFRPRIYSNAMLMLDSNEKLKLAIQDMNDDRVIQQFFGEKIKLWDPATGKVFNGREYDSFAASNILLIKSLYVANFTQGNYQETGNILRSGSQLPFAINNTVNDYLVQMEEEIASTEGVLDDIIQENIGLLRLILAFENLALFLLGAFLLILGRVIFKSYVRMFKALVRLHQFSVNKRLDRLQNFKTAINENIELRKFVQNLSKYLESLDKNVKSNLRNERTRDADERIIFKGLIIFMLKYLGLATFFLLISSGIFWFSFVSSIGSFNLLDKLNLKLSVTHKLGYQIDNILSNAGHVMTFTQRKDFLIRNSDPDEELTKNVEALATANNKLLGILSNEKGSFDNPIIEDFLKNDVCGHMPNTTSQTTCSRVTIGKSLGLLGLNAKYLRDTSTWIETFRKNRTSDNGDYCFQQLTTAVTSIVTIMQPAYEFLTTILLDEFKEEVDKQKFERLVILYIMLFWILLSTVVIQLMTINKFRGMDIMIRRILRIIPYDVVMENKAFGFFLAKEFDEELEGIKNHL